MWWKRTPEERAHRKELNKKVSPFNKDAYRLKNIDHEMAELMARNYMWVVAFVSVITTIMYGYLGWLQDPFSWIDLMILVGFVFGIAKRARWVAILFIPYFIIGHIAFMVTQGATGGIVMFLLIVVLSIQGTLGIIRLHQLRRENLSVQSESSVSSQSLNR